MKKDNVTKSPNSHIILPCNFQAAYATGNSVSLATINCVIGPTRKRANNFFYPPSSNVSFIF